MRRTRRVLNGLGGAEVNGTPSSSTRNPSPPQQSPSKRRSTRAAAPPRSPPRAARNVVATTSSNKSGTTGPRKNPPRARVVVVPTKANAPKRLIRKATATGKTKVAPKRIKRVSVLTAKSKRAPQKSTAVLKRNKAIAKANSKGKSNKDGIRKRVAKAPMAKSKTKSAPTPPAPSKGRKRGPESAGPPAKKAKKPRKGAFTLSPKPTVTDYKVDPMFESKEPLPFISPMVQGKLLIRAVITKEKGALERLTQNKKVIYSYCVPRSLDVNKTALHYAIRNGDIPAIKFLMAEKAEQELGPVSQWLIESESTGRGSYMMFGHGMKAVTVGRGGKEGNGALLKDRSMYDQCGRVTTHYSQSHIIEALNSGISMAALEKMSVLNKDYAPQYFWSNWFAYIVHAVRAGQNELAGGLIEMAIKRGGFGFNVLHQEALVRSKNNTLSAFKAVSVIKKATGNARITPIHCAATNPDPYCLSTLLASQPDFNILDGNNWTPVHYAAACKGPGPLEYLIGRGISTNAIDKDGNTPLHAAAAAGRAHNVKLILAAESRGQETESDLPEITSATRLNKVGLTPLHVAAKAGHPEVVKLLLAFPGIDGNKQTPAQYDKLTALMIACQQGHLTAVKALVGTGCKLEIQDRRGRTALAHAVINGQAHVVSYLLRLGDNHLAKDSSGNTLVHYAAAYGWYFVFKLLMEAGCCPNEPNQWKMTPIAIAFMKGHMGLVEVLLKEPGVNVNSPIDDAKGMTLLLQTCTSKPGEEMITRLKFLVETQKADCMIADSDGNNAIHYLVESEAKELDRIRREKERGWETEEKKTTHIYAALQILVTNGCDPQAKNSKGVTPISRGVQLGCFELVQKLVGLGGSVTSDPSESGDTILHFLVEHATKEEAGSFYKTCAKDPTSLAKLKEMGRAVNNAGMTPLLLTLNRHPQLTDEKEAKRLTEFVLFLVLRLDSDVNSAVDVPGNKYGSLDSVLHLTVGTNYSEDTLKILLSRKPALDPVNKNGRTPLVAAILKNNSTSARILIEAGADVNFVSEKDDGKSVIMLEVSQTTKSFNLIPFLVERRAAVKGVVDKHTGNSILHFVAKNPTGAGAVQAVRALLQAGIPVNVPNKYDRTPLHLAVNSRGGHTDASYDVEDLLLESGVNRAAGDVNGRTALHLAFLKLGKAKKAHPHGSFMDPIELVTLLTSGMKRSDIEKVDSFGQSPLHCAAVRGATISASHLLSLTSKELINARDLNGNSPFALAVLNGHEGCALMLLQAGADFLLDLNRGVGEEASVPEGWIWKTLKDEAEFRERERSESCKYSILQEIVRKDWQGLLYLMLEKLKGSGVGVTPGIEAAFKTNRLTLAAKLIDRVKVNKELITKKQSLLHTFAQEATNPTAETKELQIRILTTLISKGADVNAVDSTQASPLVYAALKWNSTLSTEFTSLMNIRCIPTLRGDNLGRTPFSAIFWKPFPQDRTLPDDMKTWAESVLYAGGNGNVLCQYPIQEPTVPAVRYVNCDKHAFDNPFMSPVATKYSPLVMAVIYGNQTVVKWLLGLKGKIDINFGDSLGRTPLMHAVRRNDIQMVKLLLSPQTYDAAKDKTPWCASSKGKKAALKVTSGLDLNAKDKKGWTAIHHLVAPVQGSAVHYVQADVILKLLESVGAVLDARSARNETPLDMAIRLKQYNMVQALAKVQKVSANTVQEYDPVPPVADNLLKIPIESSQADSKALMDRMIQERLQSDTGESLPIADSLTGLSEDNSEIIMDDVRSVPLDCLLTQVDISYGVYGLYNFYKMQLIRQTKGPQLILLFTRWGRVGQAGQYQKTPFPTLEEAVKEFKKIFRSKTGNTWDELSDTNPFLPAPKKYRLVQLERSKARYSTKFAEKIKVDFDVLEKAGESMKTNLSRDLWQLTKDLVSEHKSKSTMYRYTEDSELLPFGLLSRESLQKAEALLDSLQNILTKREALEKKADHSKEEHAQLVDSIVESSQEYYTLVLVCGFASEKIGPLFQLRDLRKQQELVKQLLHYEFASQLLLGAQFRSGAVNPFDYVYGSLGTSLGVLDEGTEEAQLILEYVYNTSDEKRRPGVERIYRVQVPGEEERLGRTGIGNRHFLWHGTQAANLLSILHRGLQVAPLGAQLSGSLFGKGIYFADMFAKSSKYCSGTGSNFMLLCEVALGNVQKVSLQNWGTSEFEPLKAGSNSLKTSNSSYKPLPSASVYWKGRTVPLGPKCDNVLPEGVYAGLDHNEYIVFQPSQVNLRYLVQYRDSKSGPEVPLQSLFT